MLLKTLFLSAHSLALFPLFSLLTETPFQNPQGHSTNASKKPKNNSTDQTSTKTGTKDDENTTIVELRESEDIDMCMMFLVRIKGLLLWNGLLSNFQLLNSLT